MSTEQKMLEARAELLAELGGLAGDPTTRFNLVEVLTEAAYLFGRQLAAEEIANEISFLKQIIGGRGLQRTWESAIDRAESIARKEATT